MIELMIWIMMSGGVLVFLPVIAARVPNPIDPVKCNWRQR